MYGLGLLSSDTAGGVPPVQHVRARTNGKPPLCHRQRARHGARVCARGAAQPAGAVPARRASGDDRADAGTTWFVSWLDPLKVLVRLPIDSGKLVISGTKITMEAPKLSGYTQRPALVRADRDRGGAGHHQAGPRRAAGRPRQDREPRTRAARCFSRRRTACSIARPSILTLQQRYRRSGRRAAIEVQLNEAVVDTGNGEVVSNKPVEVITQQATLTRRSPRGRQIR